MPGKRWKEAEEEYLHENWGKQSLQELNKNLRKLFGRKIEDDSLKDKLFKLGICSFKSTGDWLTPGQMAAMIGYERSTIKAWVKKGQIKVKRKKYYKRTELLVQRSDFIKWLENNQDKWDSKSTELYALGEEPAWLKEKREKDKTRKYKPKQWTIEEEERGLMLFNKGMTYKEISKVLNKTYYSTKNTLLRYKEKKMKKAV